jgi:hypothetical protein
MTRITEIEERAPAPVSSSNSKCENPICLRLKKFIHNDRDLLQIAFYFRINPTPLRKILDNKPISKYFVKKLEPVLDLLGRVNDPQKLLVGSPRAEKIVRLYELYLQVGSLSRAGKLQGLSRERVRQLLNKGTELGLFRYKRVRLRKRLKRPSALSAI